MLECVPRYLPARTAFPEDAAIQDIFRQLSSDVTRTATIADEIEKVFAQGGKVLAMPISWEGTLQQYAGRLHREQAGKQCVRIIDFIDAGHPSLLRMWERRQRGYQAMGYRMVATGELNLEPPA